nr:DNA (cytosine-5-)-methyltransferase (TIGR00675) [uncultured Mediterranean phage uvMED]
MELTVLDLFSGIGGFSVGLEATGKFKTIGFCEQDKFCQKVLRKHWSDVPIYEDIKKLDARKIKADVVVGGFPCQSISIAGKQKGKDDDRFLFPEMLRVIKEVQPRWIIGENVQNLINIADGQILQGIHNDLEAENYEVQTFCISAASIGAWHKRSRVWIIAADSKKLRFSGGSSEECRDKKWKFQQKKQKRCEVRSKVKRCNSSHNKSWWEQEHEALTKICRVPHGLSAELDTNRNDRIKALGNSICPPIITEIGKAIIQAEEENV